MILAYYTGAKAANQAQQNPRAALGGFASNTPVPNGRLNNLFDDVSYYQINTKQLTDCKAVVLTNTDVVTVIAPKIGIVRSEATPDYTIQIAIVTLSNGAMESIASSKDTPYIGTFQSADVTDTDLSNALVLPDIPAGGSLGVWLLRTLAMPVLQTLKDFDISTINQQRSFKFKISY